MFKLDTSNTFSYPVKFTLIDARGKHQQHVIPFDFRRLTADELRERNQADARFIELLEQYPDDPDEAQKRWATELMREGKLYPSAEQQADELLAIVEGWKEVSDGDGPLAFNRDNLIRLLNYTPGLYGAINQAFREAMSGPVPNPAARKNS